MNDNKDKILNGIRHRKITEKKAEDNKNYPKDYNIKSNFLKSNIDYNNYDNMTIEEISLCDFCDVNLLQFDNIKKINTIKRIYKNCNYNKWKPLYIRLMATSKLNSSIDPELSLKLKKDAEWLKFNSKEIVMLNKTNIFDKNSPSLEHLYKHHKLFLLPSHSKDEKNKLKHKHDFLLDCDNYNDNIESI